MARVSVIVATYNRKALLKRAMQSVFDQSMGDFELIVVDDCSPDTKAVENMVLGYGDPRVKFLRTESNSGHDSLPKNMGIKAATGEYICFLDDDDDLRVDALQILLAYAQNSKAEVVYGDYLFDGKPGWSLDFSPAKLREFNYICQGTVLARRDALMAVGGFDEEVPKFKDWNLWIRMQKNGDRFMHVPIIVAHINAQTESVSSKYKEDRDENGRYLPTFFNPADCLIYPNKTFIGARKPLRVAVYTLTMNRFEYTQRMYDAISKLAGYDFDWFVIDQGSKDGTPAWLKGLAYNNRAGWIQRIYTRFYEQNMGLAKGWNNALDWIKSEGGYDIVVKIDNDAEMLTEGWLEAMVRIFERNRKVVLSPYVEGLEGSPGGVLRMRASGESPYMMIDDKVLGIVPHLGGIVYAHDLALVKNWRFDEQAAGNKDILLSGYARRTGYSLFYMEEYRVWHIDGTKGQHEKFPFYFQQLTPQHLEDLHLADLPEEEPEGPSDALQGDLGSES